MNDGLIQELESYAEVAREGNAWYCAELMTRAARVIRNEKSRASAATDARHSQSGK